jgi:Bacterial membrane protein YfhO
MSRSRYLALIIAFAFAYFFPNIRAGGVLLPLDVLHHLGPFSASVPKELETVRNFHLTDLVTMIYPWTELFRSGGEILPLWNPYSFCGSPLLASAQTGMLFPVSWAYKLFSFGLASLVVGISKLAFCAIFAFLYYRKCGFNEIACLLGALAYMLSGQTITWLGYPGVFPVVTLPFVFWALENYLADVSRKFSTEPVVNRQSLILNRQSSIVNGATPSLVWVSAGYGLLFLGSQPQFSFVIALASGLYFAVRARSLGACGIRLCLNVALFALIGLCLAAPQILPFVEYLRESAAFRLRGSFGWKLYPWYTFVSWPLPRFFGDVNNFWGFSSVLGEAVYVGTIPLVFAGLGLILGKKDSFICGVGSVFAFGFLGLYVPVTQQLYQYLPVLSSIDNNKLMVLICFGLASFSVAGMHSFLEGRARPSGIPVLWLGIVALWTGLIAIGLVHFRAAINEMGLWRFEAREVMAWIVVVAGVIGILWLWRNRKLSTRNAGIALVAFTVCDLFRVWLNYYPSYSTDYLRPRSTSVEFLEQNLGESRFFGLDGFLPPETSVIYRLQDVRGIEGLTPYRYYQVLGKIDPGVHDLLARLQAGAPKHGKWTQETLYYRSLERYLRSNNPEILSALRRLDYWSNDVSRLERPGLLSLLGVRFILCPKGNRLAASAGFRLVHTSDAEVWENPGYWPRAFVSTQPVFVDEEEKALQVISDPAFLSFKSAVICLREGELSKHPAISSGKPELIPARVDRYTLHSVDITAESPQPGWLVLSDLFYPGWQAAIDGKPVPIFSGNYLFRAVELPPGKHHVRFVYRPLAFHVGVGLFCFALVALVATGLSTRMRRVQA